MEGKVEAQRLDPVDPELAATLMLFWTQTAWDSVSHIDAVQLFEKQSDTTSNKSDRP